MDYIIHVIVGKDLSLQDISYLIFENKKIITIYFIYNF